MVEKIVGVVERIVFENQENGFCVLRLQVKEFPDLVTAVGSMAGICAGSVLLLEGDWRMDSRFGKQFQVTRFQEERPVETEDMERYLSSGLIKGIGPVNARRLVQTFGPDTFRIIEEEPDRLVEVPGIGPKRVDMIRQAWQEHQEVKNVMVFLQKYGVSVSLGVKIYKAYGTMSIEMIRNDPYRLAEDIWGIGFKTADKIAQSIGFDHHSPARCRAGLVHMLNQAAGDGHCYLEAPELIQRTAEELEIEAEAAVLDEMIVDGRLILEDDAVYLPSAYHSECGTAGGIGRLLQSPYQGQILDLQSIIGQVEKEKGIEFDPVQVDAIQKAASSKFLVLTGGPGTGKTTTVQGIMQVFMKMGLKILLAAPTGRAAKRMTETTGKEARTIHRLLEFKPPQGYQKDEHNPLDCDGLIVDEASMIDIFLMHHLLKAVPEEAVVVLVGDVDQLPPVGAGNVLRDIMDSRVVPVVRLTRIFRQARGSMIVSNAHRINRGEYPRLKGSPEDDFFFLEEEDPEAAAGLVVDLCQRRLPSHYEIDSRQIQVISPMTRGVVGVQNLNEKLQEALNPTGPSVRFGGTTFRKRDKVMQIRNNYDKDVFNGDIGWIEDLDEEEQILAVRFDDRLVSYERSEWDEIVLAYASTVHKSQGSEYPVVVAPLTMQHYVMLQRNLLYTCITRAKKLMVLVGSKRAVALAVKNNRVSQRNTRLAQRLKEILS